MGGVPGPGSSGNEINTGAHRRKFVGPLVIGLRGAGGIDLAEPEVATFAVQPHLRVAHRLSRFIEDFAEDRGHRHDAQDEIFRINVCSGHYGRGELSVLVIGGGDESAPGAAQRVFARREVREGKAAILGSDHRLGVARTLGLEDRYASASQRSPGGRTDSDAGNSECLTRESGLQALRRILHRKNRARGYENKDNGEEQDALI